MSSTIIFFRQGRSSSRFRVTVGNHRQDVFEPFEASHSVRSIVIHEDYLNFENDIALLELASPISFNNHVIPICLPRVDVEPGVLCATTGWGATEGMVQCLSVWYVKFLCLWIWVIINL